MDRITMQDILPYLEPEARRQYGSQVAGEQVPTTTSGTVQTVVVEPDLDSFLTYIKPEHQASVRAQFEERDVRLRLMDAHSSMRFSKGTHESFQSTIVPEDASLETALAYAMADELRVAGEGFTWRQALDFATAKLAEERKAKLGPEVTQYLKQ